MFGIHMLASVAQSSEPSDFMKDVWVPLIAAAAVALVQIIAIAISYFSLRKQIGTEVGKLEVSRKTLLESQNLSLREEIRRQLDTFYGPLRELRAASRSLYDVFARAEKEEAAKQRSYFRTLRHLAQGKTLSPPDKALLEEILVLGAKQDELLTQKGWMTEKAPLSVLLGRLCAHIRILQLAAAGKMQGMDKVLEAHVFPLEIDGALESETRRLQDNFARLMDLEGGEPRLALLSADQRRIVDHYDRVYREYELKHRNAPALEDLYRRFRWNDEGGLRIPRGALILDAGCGPGRDTRYFIQHGYRVVSFDASKEMVRLCNRYPYSYCVEKAFAEVEFEGEFDAVWACASLVHLGLEQLKDALTRLGASLVPGGVLYFSLKEKGADGQERSEDGLYHYHESHEVAEICEAELGLAKIERWSNEPSGQTDSHMWSNFLYRVPRLRVKPDVVSAEAEVAGDGG